MLKGFELHISNRQKNRLLAGLKQKGAVKLVKPSKPIAEPPKPKTAAEAWLVKPFTDADGPREFETFSIKEITDLGRDGRFRTFCELWGADGNQATLRSAWLKIESENSKKHDGKIPEVANLYPQIILAAQHVREWARQGLCKKPDPAEWLKTGSYLGREYSVKPGDPPAPAGDDASMDARAAEAENELLRLGAKDFEGRYPWESPLAAVRRLEARLKQERKFRAMQ